MDWIKASERQPDLNTDRPYGREYYLTAINQGDEFQTVPMSWVRTMVRKKAVERWEWNGRISPWEVIYWMPMPEPPAKEK